MVDLSISRLRRRTPRKKKHLVDFDHSALSGSYKKAKFVTKISIFNFKNIE